MPDNQGEEQFPLNRFKLPNSLVTLYGLGLVVVAILFYSLPKDAALTPTMKFVLYLCGAGLAVLILASATRIAAKKIDQLLLNSEALGRLRDLRGVLKSPDFEIRFKERQHIAGPDAKKIPRLERHPVKVTAAFTSWSGQKAERVSETSLPVMEGMTENVSASGALVSTPFRLGDTLFLVARLDIGSKEFPRAVLCQAKRFESTGDASYPSQCGIKFLTREELLQIFSQKGLEELPSEFLQYDMRKQEAFDKYLEKMSN